MNREEAIRILYTETTGEALAEIEYYNGFGGKTAANRQPVMREVRPERKQKESDNAHLEGQISLEV